MNIFTQSLCTKKMRLKLFFKRILAGLNTGILTSLTGRYTNVYVVRNLKCVDQSVYMPSDFFFFFFLIIFCVRHRFEKIDS